MPGSVATAIDLLDADPCKLAAGPPLIPELPYLLPLGGRVFSMSMRPQRAGDAVVLESPLFEPTSGGLGSELDECLCA